MIRTLCLATLAATMLLADASPSQAQIRFGIGIGSGGYGGFYPYGGMGYGGYYPYGGYGGYPYGYGGSWWGMDPNLYRRPSYSQPRTYTRTVVVQPKPIGDGQPIKIFSLDDTGTDLHYKLNGNEYVIKPGESQLLIYDRNWVLSFDRGGDFGTAEYTLSSGQYWFELTEDHGWELYHDADVSKITKQNEELKKNAIPEEAPLPLPRPKGKAF